MPRLSAASTCQAVEKFGSVRLSASGPRRDRSKLGLGLGGRSGGLLPAMLSGVSGTVCNGLTWMLKLQEFDGFRDRMTGLPHFGGPENPSAGIPCSSSGFGSTAFAAE